MPPDSSSFQWLNMPNTAVPEYMGAFTMTARAGTDLWRKRSSDTFTAPVLYTTPLTSSFHQASILVAANWLYDQDQAGLVIFSSPFSSNTPSSNTNNTNPAGNWIKAGLSLSSSGTCTACSTTSSPTGCDFVSVDLPPNAARELRVKFEKVGDALWISFDDGREWRKSREVTWFFEGVEEKQLRVGVYASRPQSFMGGRNEALVVECEGLEVLGWD